MKNHLEVVPLWKNSFFDQIDRVLESFKKLYFMVFCIDLCWLSIQLLDELLPTQTFPADLSYKHVPKSLDKSLDELPLPSAEDERSDVELSKSGNTVEPVETAAPLIRVPDFGVSRAAEVPEAADLQAISDDQVCWVWWVIRIQSDVLIEWCRYDWIADSKHLYRAFIKPWLWEFEVF